MHVPGETQDILTADETQHFAIPHHHHSSHVACFHALKHMGNGIFGANGIKGVQERNGLRRLSISPGLSRRPRQEHSGEHSP